MLVADTAVDIAVDIAVAVQVGLALALLVHVWDFWDLLVVG